MLLSNPSIYWHSTVACIFFLCKNHIACTFFLQILVQVKYLLYLRQKMKKKRIFLPNYLAMSAFCCNFALANIKEMTIDITDMCSHLQRKLFSQDGEYRAIRGQIETDPTLTAVVRSRQLHIYRDGKKILILAGKSTPKIIRDDKLNQLL